MKQQGILHSFILRAEQDGNRFKLKLQHIQSGEQQVFTSWAELIRYVNCDLHKSNVLESKARQKKDQ